MSRPAASIQAEIDRLETFLSGADTTIANVGNDGTNVGLINRKDATARLKELYRDLRNANGFARFPRGVVTGLR
jgi:hypothetical protein